MGSTPIALLWRRKKEDIMPIIMHSLFFFVRGLGAVLGISFAWFLGSEGTAIMTKGRNIVLFAILILGFIILFKHTSSGMTI